MYLPYHQISYANLDYHFSLVFIADLFSLCVTIYSHLHTPVVSYTFYAT